MDPTANLEEQRRIIARASQDASEPGDFERLVELSQALDEWLSRKGFPPAPWQQFVDGKAIVAVRTALKLDRAKVAPEDVSVPHATFRGVIDRLVAR